MSGTELAASDQKARRPIGLVLLGLFLLAAAGALVYDRLHAHAYIAPAPKPYQYGIKQRVENKVSYRQSSFFGKAPDTSSTAYLAELTDKIATRFHYDFRGSEPADLNYKYSVDAQVRTTYGSKDSPQGLSTVWSKQYRLLEPVSGTKNTKDLTFDPVVDIPFSQFVSDVGQFKKTFSAPLNSEMIVNLNVQVSGTVNGTPFTSNKTSTVSTSLDQDVYQLGVKFEKEDNQQVKSSRTRPLTDTIATYELLIAAVLAVAGMAYFVLGLRRQRAQTPYQRELERIYRFHDGIIVRAKHPANLARKNVVSVQSFDDLLNLEEELKTPIIASPLGDKATRFMIADNDIAYVFTLGVSTKAAPPSAPAPEEPKAATKPAVQPAQGMAMTPPEPTHITIQTAPVLEETVKVQHTPAAVAGNDDAKSPTRPRRRPHARVQSDATDTDN